VPYVVKTGEKPERIHNICPVYGKVSGTHRERN